MKIALLSDWFLPRRGGIEWQMWNLACQLQQKQEHTVHIITPIPGPDYLDGIPIYRLPGPLVPSIQVAWHPQTFRALKQILQREQYDIVHIHLSLLTTTGVIGGYLCQQLSIPTLFTFHSVAGNWKMLIGLFCWLLRVKEWSAKFSAVSPIVAHDFQPLVSPHQIGILPNSIDTTFWKAIPPEDTADSDPIQLVSVTRFVPRKRTNALLRIFHRLRTERPDISIHLTLVGTGLFEKYLKWRVRRLGLAADITFTGYLTATEIRNILVRSTLFILPSINESFGTAALEARTAGLPIIGRSQSGLHSFIYSGVDGLLASTDEMMYQQLVYLCDNLELRRRVAQNNWETLPLYDWGLQTKHHIQLYEQAIDLVPQAKQPMAIG